MRIIPKNTKVKLQFYKGVTITDVIIGMIGMLFLVLAVSSNLTFKWIIAIAVLMFFVPLFIPVGEVKVYTCIFHAIKYCFSKKTFSKQKRGKGNIGSIIPYEKIQDNIITEKDGTLTAVIEIKPIEFNMLAEHKQNYYIDTMLSNIIKGIGLFQEINIVKLERPVIFDNYVKNEFDRLNELIQENESGNLSEEEFRARSTIIEDRINIVGRINEEEKIFTSSFYIVVHDIDRKSLDSNALMVETIFNNNNIDAKRLNSNELFLFLKYSFGNDFDERVVVEEKEYIAKAVPNKVEFKISKVIQDGKSISQFVITDYPIQVYNAWGKELFDMPNTKVVLKAVPVERVKAIKRIDGAINEILTQKDLGKASFQIDRETHLSSLQSTLVGLQNENESFLDCSVVVTVYDNPKQTTNKKIVKRKLREQGFKFSEMFGRQTDTYLETMISKGNQTKISRGLNSSSLSASFPFVSNEILDEKGVLIGENKLPAFVDFFKRDDERVNSNMVIIGKSGSGKSYATKTILTNLAGNNAKVFILDPENEYGNLAKNLNGKSLDVSSSKDGRINPFHIIENLDDDNSDGTNNSFFSHLQFLEEFFRLILVGINADSLELLNKMILDVYALKKITAKTNLSKLKSKDYPTFQTLADLIDKKLNEEKDDYNKSCLKVLSNYLSKFKKGGRNSAIWNGETTFDPKENFMCFNFQKLLANKNNIIANAQMLLVLKWLDNEVIKNRDYNTMHNSNRKIIIAIDEAHVFIDEKHPIALDFMYNLAKRIRKYDGMQIVITQNIKDFVGSPDIARKSSAIINVSQYSLIFSLSPNDMTDLCKLYENAGEINESERDNIVNLPRGCAFMITGPAKRTNLRIVASEQTREIFEN